MNGARSGSSRDEALRDGGELSDDVMDQTSEIGGDEQQARQDAGHECGGVPTISPYIHRQCRKPDPPCPR